MHIYFWMFRNSSIYVLPATKNVINIKLQKTPLVGHFLICNINESTNAQVSDLFFSMYLVVWKGHEISHACRETKQGKKWSWSYTSWIHQREQRVAEVRRNVWRSSTPKPSSKQGHLQQVGQDLHLWSSKCLLGWRIHNFSERPVFSVQLTSQ